MDANGVTIGDPAQWSTRHANRNPAWCSIQSLGFLLSEQKDARICIELRDGIAPIGNVHRPILDTLGCGVLTEPLKILPVKSGTKNMAMSMARSVTGLGKSASKLGNSASKLGKLDGDEDLASPATISFQVIDANLLKGQRKVFFIRHGESVWNKAQSAMNLRKMFNARDHPLSELGVEQAEALSSRIKQSGDSSPIFKPDVIYVSPLTRAVQTAVISLQEVFSQPAALKEVILMASAREKQNFLGLDTKSQSTGKDIIQRSLSELKTAYKDRHGEIVKTFKELRFDAEEVSDQWWHGAHKESAVQLEIRLNEFMSHLLYTPHHVIVVVGHSHFFREIFRRYLSQEFRDYDPNFVTELQSGKLMNCGVAMLQLDPDLASSGPITSVELVFDTQLLPHKSFFRRWRCCCFCASRQKRQQGRYYAETE